MELPSDTALFAQIAGSGLLVFGLLMRDICVFILYPDPTLDPIRNDDSIRDANEIPMITVVFLFVMVLVFNKFTVQCAWTRATTQAASDPVLWNRKDPDESASHHKLPSSILNRILNDCYHD